MKSLSNATDIFKKALEIAEYTSARLELSYIGSEHFIYAFLCLPECEAYKILAREGVRKEEYGKLLYRYADKNYTVKGITDRMQKAYDSAVDLAKKDGILANTAHMMYQILGLGQSCGVQVLKYFADVDLLKMNTIAALRAFKNKKE